MTIYRSKTILIPQDQNLTELLHSSAYPELPESHIICGDNLTNRSITIGELRNRAGRIANGLKKALRPKDQTRWAIILPNSVEFLEISHAVLWTGGVICPINHALKASEIGHGLAVSRPEYVIVYGLVLSAVQEAIKIAGAELKKQGVRWKKPQLITTIVRAGWHAHIPDDFFAHDVLTIPHHNDTSIRLASIHLSSGTTGKPKGVELTHYNYVSNCYQLFDHDPAVYNPRSKTVAYTPWVHIGATTVPLFVGPWTGMFHHAMPAYNPEKFGSLVGSIQATMFSGVPSVVISMANGEMTSKYDFSRAQVINVGGAPFKKEMVKKLYSRAPWKLNQVYGMTEAAGYVAYQRLNEEPPEGFIGSFLPNIEARLIKEGTCEDVEVGGPGELWIRGPNITRGYAFNEEANLRAFPEKGWYNTGDVCVIDSEGRVGVVGRTKDLIKYKGFQVSPVELESYVNSHPDVLEAGVGAIWDESQLTELPAAWVILKPHVGGTNAIKAALVNIQKAIDGQVSGYKKLRGGVWSVQSLPKNATGKILRKEMVTMRDGPCSLDQHIRSRL
ncbi:uncharacterized protein PV09_06385 [Verruconis gallopava]|uniref:AMP-dependent synthetase/ligase domain-containing protein n=1 Tax=Verruconis gallopava TaxID=253628 RepID=A0A0D1YNC2_9PEZI|nr:uncharacterized protein PV09_06385 [Verruconis gallopava]KIW02232.1 hypothetical protein PV09_06385 [Verruconis gallopava]